MDTSTIYAPELALAIKAMFYWVIFSTLLALTFVGLFLTVRPRMRHAHRVNERLTERLAVKSKELVEEKAASAALADTLRKRIDKLETTSEALTTELRRVDRIREKTEKRCSALNKLVEHVDLIDLPSVPSPLLSQPLPIDTQPPELEIDLELLRDESDVPQAWFDSIDAALATSRRPPAPRT